MFGIFDIDTYNIGTSQGLRCSGHLRCSNFARKSNFAKLAMFDFKRTIAKKAELRKIPCPSRSNNLRKGVLCAFRPAKASPLGRGGTEGDGEGKPGRKEPLRSDKQALCQSDTIAVQSCLVAALPSQSRSARQLPQRGSHWHVGQLSSGRAKHDVSETVVLRCLGQQQLDKVRLSRSACPL